MAVPAIALSTSPPSGLSSFPSSEFDFTSRSAPSSSTTSAAHKPTMGGLSCLFSPSSSSASRPASSSSYNFVARDEPNEQLPSSYSYLPFSSSLKRRDQSPISILQGPVSCSTSTSPPTGFSGQWNGHFHFHSQSSSSRARRDRLVPNALRSSTDSSVCLVEGFTTSSKEDSPDLSCPLYAQELLEGAQSRHKIFNQKFVINAFYEAERAHRGQFRASGDPYLQHCLETAILLANIGATSTVVAAGLLHDTLDDAFMNYDYISQMFGAGVADLVVGVSKLSQFSKLARDSNTANKMAEADRLHTMFLAMADARAVLIKLADRLHNMMTLGALPLAKQQRFAKETLEIFAPLANRLGISCWKEQLESLCFKHLDPDQHQELTSKLVNCFDKVMISSATEKLGEALNEQGVSYHVLSGRHKSLYSIYRKMLKKKLNTDEIHDIHGLRLIVEDEEDCYKSLDIVHSLWPKIPGKFKDYITHPKFNGYQSLHTVVMTEDMVPIEVQIRTKEMHSQAEYGIAAHWRYKEGESKHSSNVLHLVEWARWVVTWHCQTMNKEGTSSLGVKNSSSWPPCPFPSYGCPFSCSPHSDQDGPIYVIMIENEKMSVQEFPANSTVKDVSMGFSGEGSRWSSYGFMLKEKLRPLLNYEPVNNINQMLKMGDVIELTPAISDKCLTECRKEIQRMYNGNLTFAPRTAWDS